jgi:hypothetical protein
LPSAGGDARVPLAGGGKILPGWLMAIGFTAAFGVEEAKIFQYFERNIQIFEYFVQSDFFLIKILRCRL